MAGPPDPLYGLKENVIIGKLIPAGTGFVHGRFQAVEKVLGQTGSSQWIEIQDTGSAD